MTAPVDHVYALAAGTMLHEYEIRSVLGHGGFGITYLAQDTLLDEPVAIKEYLPSYLAARLADKTVGPKVEGDREAFDKGVAAFLNEARTIARFRHPNIVGVRRYFDMHGTGYIVLNYESGPSLDAMLDKGALGEAALRRILTGAIDGLALVHAAGVLHRDIKPSNIIVRPDGSPVLIDFGAARDYAGKTTHMTTIMSPGYAPPEQYGEGGVQGVWTDFYALGATAYQCIAGKRPPDSLNRLNLARLKKDPLIPAEQAGVGRYPPALLRAIDWMLCLDERARPKDAGQLKSYLESEQGAPLKGRRPGLVWVGVATCGLVLLAGAGVLVYRNSENARETERASAQLRDISSAGYDRARIQAVLRRCAPDCAAATEAEAQRRYGQIDTEAVRFTAAQTDPDRLDAYLHDCVACLSRPAAEARLRTLRDEANARQRRETDDDSFRAAATRGELDAYIENCSLCGHVGEARRRLAELTPPPAPANTAPVAAAAPSPAPVPPEAATKPTSERVVRDAVALNEIKNRLYEQGLDPGEPGSAAMADAIRVFEEKTGLPPLDIPTEGLLEALRAAPVLKPWGAIVFDKDESKWGMAWSAASRREALATAKDRCGSDKCTATVTIHGAQCAAFALSPRGWSINWKDDEGLARQTALDDCGKRGVACRIIGATCADGSGRSR